jgi:lysophospholipase L1-like esterase
MNVSHRTLVLIALCTIVCASVWPRAPRARGAEPEAREATSVVAIATHEAIDARRVYVVAAIGDSLTDARVGGAKYLRDLARRCPESRFDAYGIGGQTTFDMRARFDGDVFGAGKPSYTHVVVLGGVNDLIMGVDAARLTKIEEQLTSMYRTARARGVSVVAATIPPHPLAGAFARALDAWIRTNDDVASVADLATRLACGSPDLLCAEYRKTPGDRIHWGDAGHRAVADEFARVAFSDCR